MFYVRCLVSTKFLLHLRSRESWRRAIAGGECSDDATEAGVEVVVDSPDHVELPHKSTNVPRIYGDLTGGGGSPTTRKLDRMD